MSLMHPKGRDTDHLVYELVTTMYKEAKASTPQNSYAMAGRLYAAKSGWLLLSVPNPIVRGIFDTLTEPGIELPGFKGSGLNAHISVMRPEEIDQIGGIDKVTERGHMFRYTLGPLKTVEPHGWTEMSRVWMVEVSSPELKKLRVSYGLSPLPNENRFKFHITVAVRRRNVLNPSSETSKAASDRWFLEEALHGRLSQPIQWDPQQSVLGNAAGYVGGVLTDAQRRMQAAHGSRRLMTANNPDQQWSDFLGSLQGKDPVVTHPADKMLQMFS